jgi:hypothetical protein
MSFAWGEADTSGVWLSPVVTPMYVSWRFMHFECYLLVVIGSYLLQSKSYRGQK